MVKVSVITPIYNTGKFLSECINTILNQTLTDWELILVNDGSPDNSDEICQKYVAKDPRIHYYYQENAGVSVARNLGLSKASGEYLYCMDSDDTLDADFLKTSYQTVLRSDADITVIGEWYRRRLPRPAALPTCAMMIKKAFLDQYPNIRYPEGIQPCEDGLFSHQLMALTDKIAFNPNGIYHYRQHGGGNHIAINKSCEKVLNQIPKWFEILDEFYTKHKLFKTKGRHLLRFLEDEPFSLRLEKMPFSLEQKEILTAMIHRFIQKYNLDSFVDKTFSRRFILFLNSSSYAEYERRLKKEHQKLWWKILFLTILMKLTFYKKWRSRLKQKLKKLKI